MKVSG